MKKQNILIKQILFVLSSIGIFAASTTVLIIGTLIAGKYDAAIITFIAFLAMFNIHWRTPERVIYLSLILPEKAQHSIKRAGGGTIFLHGHMKEYYRGVIDCRHDIKNNNTERRDAAIKKEATDAWRIGYTMRRNTRWA